MSPSNQSPAGSKIAPLVFVVDDEPMLLELAHMVLGPQGYNVKTFRDPDLALETFTQIKPRPELIVTDYAMHTMSGLDLIKACRDVDPQQKIILISGTVGEEVYADSLTKPNRFLAKPFLSADLIDVVRSVLAG